MRYLVGFVLVLAVVAMPLHAGAEDSAAVATSEHSLLQLPASEPVPWLRLELDSAGLQMTSAGEALSAFELQETQRRKRRVRIGVGVTVPLVVVGVFLGGMAAAISSGFEM